MGINGIKKIMNEFATDQKLENYSGKTLGIDTSIYLYKFAYDDGDPVSRFSQQIAKFKQYDITPIYIFDGKPNNLKSDVLEKRRKARQDKEEKIKVLTETGDLEKAKAIQKSLIKITKEMIDSVKELFDKRNIKYISPQVSEADKVLGILNNRGLVDAVVSNDMDIFLFGGKEILTNLDNAGNIRVYLYSEILEFNGITQEQFMDISICCGTDYYPEGVKGLGPVKAMKCIKKYKNLIDAMPTLIKSTLTLDRYNEIVEIFNGKLDESDNSLLNLSESV